MNNIKLTKLSQYIDHYTSLWDCHGMISVQYKGDVIYKRELGYANIENNIATTDKTTLSIASVSKQFTAFAIMLLYDKKLLDIDRPAMEYLPADIMISNSVHVHHLLSHTSGLYNFYTFDTDFFGDYNTKEYVRSDYINRYINVPSTEEAGLTFQYNNTNYNLLAWIIEHVSGVGYNDFLQKHIFEPLNMTRTYFDDGETHMENRASNYVRHYDKNVRAPYHNPRFSIGTGGIISNISDLHKWYDCLRNRQLVEEKTYERFFSVNQSHYCYGLEKDEYCGHQRFKHGGDYLGVSTYVQYFFDVDLCILILSNNEEMNQYRVGDELSLILFGEEVALPTKHKEIEYSSLLLQHYTGTYVKDRLALEYSCEKLYYVRFKGNLFIELYPVGEGKFVRRYYDQQEPYHIAMKSDGTPLFLNYPKLKLKTIK